MSFSHIAGFILCMLFVVGMQAWYEKEQAAHEAYQAQLARLALLEEQQREEAERKRLLAEKKRQEEKAFDTHLLSQASAASRQVDWKLLTNDVQNGKVVFTHLGWEFTESELNETLGESSLPRFNSAWMDGLNRTAAVSTMGIDKRHHFSNSYLVGIHPFDVDNPWLPLYLLAKRKIYQLDKDQYGMREVWQNSAQAFVQLRGDCEDHAMVLADWLISEGLDARVVTGTYDGGGHAWVVVYKNEKVFLLEATSKRARKSWSHYPLASAATAYRAQEMFNRDTLWVFDDEKGTQDYKMSNWREASKFYPLSSNL